jgi:integrase
LNWAARRDEVSFNENPARGIERNRERGRERFLSTAELGRLGDALRLVETTGLPHSVDETKPGAKHARKPQNRKGVADPFAVAAIRLLILTGARLRKILNGEWRFFDFERGILRLPDSKTGAYSQDTPLRRSAGLLDRSDASPSGQYEFSVQQSARAASRVDSAMRPLFRPLYISINSA